MKSIICLLVLLLSSTAFAAVIELTPENFDQ